MSGLQEQVAAVPFFDLRPEVEELWEELNTALQGVLRSGKFILGPNVAAFEEEAARYLGVGQAVGLNSGTDALVIGLRALGVGPGDEVLVPSYTFFATAEAVSQIGARPVFVDIDPATFTLDPADVEARCTPRAKAVIPVHLFGHAADMGPVLDLAEDRGLAVLEDAAQAFGGLHRDRKLGSLGDGAAFSFFPTKTLGCYGDGGLFATDDAEAARRARMLRSHGSEVKYRNEVLGYNSRLSEFQAAVLRVKLPRVDAWNERRRALASGYDRALTGVPGLTTPRAAPHAHHVYHQYTVRIPRDRRDRIRQSLARAAIETMVYYPVPVHRLPIYAGSPELPETEAASEEALSLPLWPGMGAGAQERVAGALRAALVDGDRRWEVA